VSQWLHGPDHGGGSCWIQAVTNYVCVCENEQCMPPPSRRSAPECSVTLLRQAIAIWLLVEGKTSLVIIAMVETIVFLWTTFCRGGGRVV